MESALALKLAELLKDCEKRERAIQDKEASLEGREKAVLSSLEAQAKRGEELTAEAARYQNFRDLATERQKNEDQARKNAADLERISDERSRWARELEQAQEDIRRTGDDLSGFKARLEAREADLRKQEETLRDEKIRHHEKVLKELAIIDQKKMELVR